MGEPLADRPSATEALHHVRGALTTVARHVAPASRETLNGLARELARLGERVRDVEADRDLARAERDRLRDLISTPHTADFLEAVRIESAHQRERWGDAHDESKGPEAWFWTLAYLAGKALAKPEKRLHHIVSSAALLLNWHRIEVERGGAVEDDPDQERWLAELARECRACVHFGVPCGGCQQGSVCDGFCQSCDEPAEDEVEFWGDNDWGGSHLG